MKAAWWIKQAEKAGWRVHSCRRGVLSMVCKRQGCSGSIDRPMISLGPVPAPCELPHHGQYGQPVFDLYKDLVSDLVKRRHSLGLSQEEVNAAAGFADGHLSKLESFARIGQFPTMVAWANTLGTGLSLAPMPLPEQTARAIEDRPRPLLEKQEQRYPFDDR